MAGDLLPTADATYDVGSGALRWQDIFSTSLSTVSATLSGNLSAANAALSGTLTAASATLSGALSAGSLSSGTGVFSGAVDVSGLLRALGGLTISGGLTATSGTLSSLTVSGASSLTNTTNSGNLAVGGLLTAPSPTFTGTATSAAINNSGTVTTTNLTATGQVQTPSIQSVTSIQVGNDLYPSVNNLFSNGTSSNRWAALWAIAGDITTLGVNLLNATNVVISSGLSVGGTMSVANITTGNVTASGAVGAAGAVTSSTSMSTPLVYASTGVQAEALASYSGGDVTVSSALVPSGSRDLGSSGSRWSSIYANGIDANTGSITTLSSSAGTITNLSVPGTVSTPNLYSGSSADIAVGSSLVSGVSKNLGSATYPWIYAYVTNLVSSNLATGPITASTLAATSATLSGALTAASASLSGALTAASATISGTLSVGTLSLSSLSTGAITASSLTASGAVNSATAFTSGLAQHNGGMLGNVVAVGSFSETNTILQYEYNDLEDCTTLRNVRNAHTPRIELGYNPQLIRMTGNASISGTLSSGAITAPSLKYTGAFGETNPLISYQYLSGDTDDTTVISTTRNGNYPRVEVGSPAAGGKVRVYADAFDIHSGIRHDGEGLAIKRWVGFDTNATDADVPALPYRNFGGTDVEVYVRTIATRAPSTSTLVACNVLCRRAANRNPATHDYVTTYRPWIPPFTWLTVAFDLVGTPTPTGTGWYYEASPYTIGPWWYVDLAVFYYGGISTDVQGQPVSVEMLYY